LWIGKGPENYLKTLLLFSLSARLFGNFVIILGDGRVCMKTYLLLRNNRQSGPYTLDELLVEGLRPQDLVWVEGQSASWRYPAELDELKTLVLPPVLDDALDLGFVEVQNRVVPQHSVLEPMATGMLESPSMRISATPDTLRAPGILADLPSLPAASMMNDQSVPAFDALAGLLPDDDLMPTMAWQSVKEPNSGDMPPHRLEVRAGSESAGTLTSVASPVGPSKVKVLLPAALPDKTMVVIRRRDLDGQPIAEPKTRTRRPVLEFIPEEVDTAPEAAVPVVTSEQKQADVLLADRQDTIVSKATETEKQTAVEAALPVRSNLQTVEPDADIIPDRVETVLTTNQSGVTETSAADLMPVMQEIYESAPESAAPTLQVNISLVQKIAVITAIISLVAVAILLANSIFNPNAYQYGTKPASAVSKQGSPANAPGTVKP
jgi:hypothetical protein